MRWNKVHKQMMGLFLIIASMVMCWQSVKADMIVEPEGNKFYLTHKGDCEYEYRSYTADGLLGKVKVYESPEDNKKVNEIPNGETVFILFTYEDEKGNLWGVCDSMKLSGWIPLKYMDLVYDHISFCEEYAEDIVALEEERIVPAEYRDKEVQLWNYPGAEKSFSVSYEGAYAIKYSKVYEEANGRKWGYVDYYYGMDGWVCLENPEADFAALFPEGCTIVHTDADDLEEDAAIEEEEVVPDDSKVKKELWITGGLIFGVIVITGGILMWLRKKR